ncbi:MAG TPA: carboxypeptidase-like regulatory domain-containing protein, partial [Longimicrobium sp.]|nr:carboxypeptidase-like regulatory domain-containing protein [Longimicrobium sp.]
MRSITRLLSFLFILLLGMDGVAAAQATGALAGRVTGPGGEPVADASVVVERAGGGGRRTARTDAEGGWRVGGLAAGRYRVTASRIGFAPVTETAEVAGGETRLELRLAERTVEVEGVEARSRAAERERTRFETEAGVTSRVIGGRELKLLP